MRLTDHEWATAQTVCTTEQLQAIDLWRRGCGYKRIAVVLQISRDSARDRVHRGTTKLARHYAAQDDIRTPQVHSPTAGSGS